ncbi:unnamed protein product [Ectocarpus fasciculatus]
MPLQERDLCCILLNSRDVMARPLFPMDRRVSVLCLFLFLVRLVWLWWGCITIFLGHVGKSTMRGYERRKELGGGGRLLCFVSLCVPVARACLSFSSESQGKMNACTIYNSHPRRAPRLHHELSIPGSPAGHRCGACAFRDLTYVNEMGRREGQQGRELSVGAPFAGRGLGLPVVLIYFFWVCFV